MVWATLLVVCIATFGILPAYGEEDLHLEARLSHDNAIVKQFACDESVETWVDLLMSFFIHANEEALRKRNIVDNMLLDPLHDLRHGLAVRTAR